MISRLKWDNRASVSAIQALDERPVPAAGGGSHLSRGSNRKERTDGLVGPARARRWEMVDGHLETDSVENNLPVEKGPPNGLLGVPRLNNLS